MLGRVLVAPTRALRAQTFAFRSFSSCAARFESLPTKEQVATPYKARGEFVRPKVEGSAIVSNVETLSPWRNMERIRLLIGLEYGVSLSAQSRTL